MAGHDTTDSFHALTRRIREFSEARDWEKFHDPKSLVLAIVGEVGELAELFQWVPADEAREGVRKQRAAEEISDVLIYLVRLADILRIDIGAAAHAKLSDSERRFRPEDFQGRAPSKE